jgi:hypothetical protein
MKSPSGTPAAYDCCSHCTRLLHMPPRLSGTAVPPIEEEKGTATCHA